MNHMHMNQTKVNMVFCREIILCSIHLSFKFLSLFCPVWQMASKEATRDTCKNLTRRSFQTSFVNIFNYDLGYLNSHRDRCLVTVIFSEKQEHNRMRLWVKPATSDQPMVFRSSHPGRDGWLDVDTVRDSHDLVVFTGEDMEQVRDTEEV